MRLEFLKISKFLCPLRSVLERVPKPYAFLWQRLASANFWFLRKSRHLILSFSEWRLDDKGLVLGVTALALPLFLLIGTLVVQGGQLYIRQAQLQFVARQAANSSLIPVSNLLKVRAEQNYQATCAVDLPPSICSSDDLFDFLSLAQIQVILAESSTYSLVQTEAQSFVEITDPAALLSSDELTVEFPYNYDGGTTAVARVGIEEPQTAWFGNLLRPENYRLKVEAHSFLKLNNS